MSADLDLANAPKIVQIQAVAALDRVRNEFARYAKVRELVLGGRSRGRYIADLVTLLRHDADDAPQDDISHDVYAVEVLDADQDSTWTTVVNGRADHRFFDGASARWEAILHAVGQANGHNDHIAAFYAGRVLGLKDEG